MPKRMRRVGIGLAAIGAAAALAACLSALAATPQKLSVTLDWTPNPDHVGLFYARDEGLFAAAGLSVTLRAPSDPTSPLKLVAVGRTDLAVSYEQEVFYAAAKKVPVVAVAAVVPRPLNSLMWIDKSITSIAGLKGRKIGITGVPSDYATLDTVLAKGHLTRADVHIVSVGYNLLPALLAHRVDAVIGVYRNVEGVDLTQRKLNPTVIPVDSAGVPSYDELVLVASRDRLAKDPAYANAVKRFVAAFVQGTVQARAHPGTSLQILSKDTAGNKAFLKVATPLTLALLTGAHGAGCMRTSEWQRFGAWMSARHLLAKPIAARTVMTTRFLPARCAAS
ncbi:MAG TPA: ABC transporter substrate-binding protein [Gaiellaceae bacterium]|nr:ABC transporter substrate-binding protein [Gaiellaceae bacterium]